MPPDTANLQQRMVRLIEANGPLSLAEFMHIALLDPDQGYYSGEHVFGAKGDFVTAPQISQVFGELIGIWAVCVWQAMGKPDRFCLAELGPGRGELMEDALRAAASVPGFMGSVRIFMIEASSRLATMQREKLAGLGAQVSHITDLPAMDSGPAILIANEFFDALPVRQFAKISGIWRERCVGLNQLGKLDWAWGNAIVDHSILPDGHEDEPDGSVFEYSPARAAWAEQIGSLLCEREGAALIIDYGHAKSGFGDTFQAVRRHQSVDPLSDPGSADLTSHVDFQALAAAAKTGGSQVSPVITQRQFLLQMGLEERTNMLKQAKTAAVADRIETASQRLVHREAMGHLFKVIAFAGPQTRNRLGFLPPFADPQPTTSHNRD